MFLLSLSLCLAAGGEDRAPDLELLPWRWASSSECAFPSWVAGTGAARLLATRHEPDGSATLLLHELGEAAPRVLASGSDWFLNWADFPAAASLSDGTLAWTWLVRHAENAHSYATRVQLVGASGEPCAARALEEHHGRGEHGFVSLAPLGTDEGFLALWLDGRAAAEQESVEEQGRTEHAGRTRLYARTLRRSAAGALELGPETLVDDDTCSCCPTSLVRLADGTHLAAWRDRLPGEVRDIALARFDGARWSAPELLHADGWEIDGCPVNGPRLAAAPAATAATWYTGAGGGGVFVSLGDAGGRNFGAPLRIDAGAAVGRGDVVFLADGSLLVGWIEHGRSASSWCLRRVRPGSEPGPVLVVAEVSSARSSGFLRLAADGTDALVATTESEPGRCVVVRRVRPSP